MKYTVQVVYPQFVEVFDVNVEDDNLNIELKQLLQEPLKKKGALSLDLSREVKDDYSAFPLEYGDLIVVQVGNFCIVGERSDGETKWYRFSSTEILEYLFANNITARILPYLKEDKEILLNSILSDFIRNDYSYNNLNRKVKYLKLAILLSFIKDTISTDYSRIIFDETVLGDIEIDEIPLSLRFSGKKTLRAAKVNNVMKVLTVLHNSGKVEHLPRFMEDVFFVNTPNNGEKVKVIFGESGIKFDYQVLPSKNYVFDLGDKQYTLNIGNSIKESVRGKVYVYNGDEKDLMIKAAGEEE